eukprot:s4767_g5.t1
MLDQVSALLMSLMVLSAYIVVGSRKRLVTALRRFCTGKLLRMFLCLRLDVQVQDFPSCTPVAPSCELLLMEALWQGICSLLPRYTDEELELMREIPYELVESVVECSYSLWTWCANTFMIQDVPMIAEQGNPQDGMQSCCFLSCNICYDLEGGLRRQGLLLAAGPPRVP